MATKVNIIIIVLIQSLWFPLVCQTKISDLYDEAYEQFSDGKYDDALITNFKALKLAESSKNCDHIAYAYLQVGKMYYYTSDRRQALFYFFKSKLLSDSCQVDTIQHTVNYNIGAMYVELNILDSAVYFLNKAKVILESTNKYADLSKINAVMADMYLHNLSNYNEAEKYIIQAEKYAEKSQDKAWIAFAKMKRSILFQKLKKYDKALVVLQSALNLYNELGAIEGKMYAMKNMMNIMVITNHPDAQKTISRFLAIKDSIFRAEGASKIAEYKTIYETEKKEQENELLQKENNLNQAKLETRNRTIIILVFAIVLIGVVIVWRINTNKLKKKELELEASQKIQKEKERISRDLHDNVGGQLSYILYSLDDIKSEDKQKREELSKNINESVRNVIQNLRETIWAINDENVTTSNISDRLKIYSRQMFKNTNTKILFHENISNDIILNSVVGLNLFRICQEIINNAFKYANASEIIIEVSAYNKIEIKIRDNGKGFDLSNVSKEGFGLKNIESRANESNIEVKQESIINVGTFYNLSI